MVEIPAGEFRMGSESADIHPEDGEAPVRAVRLRRFAITATCVTNAEFAAFVESTGYVTDAESYGWSFVFAGLVHPDAGDDVIDGRVPAAPWWRGVKGASWRFPQGRGSGIDDMPDHPVVHVSWNDAVAYAAWAHLRLPTDAEWERAARGGLDQANYPWGNELVPSGVHHANIWQGSFPESNTAEDGFVGTAPADAFPANAFGLHGAAGNVWEWVADWFSPNWHVASNSAVIEDPVGPLTGSTKVLRGGSYLCHASYCNRYRVSARTHNAPDTSLGHTGFRLAADA